MAAITISREYGSRGAAIGARVAERLGWRYVDDGLRHFYRVDWEDPLLYHLVLNLGPLSEEEASHLVLQAAPVEANPGGQG